MDCNTKSRRYALVNTVFVAALLSGLLCSLAVQAGTKWTNDAGDNAWNNPKNWDSGELPDDGTNVVINRSGEDRAVVKERPESSDFTPFISGELEIRAPFIQSRGNRPFDLQPGGVINVYSLFYPKQRHGLRFRGGGWVNLHKGTVRLPEINERHIKERYGFTVHGGTLDVRSNLPLKSKGELHIKGGKVKVAGDVQLSSRTRFHVIGVESEAISIGGDWVQQEGSTLHLEIGRNGITPIEVDGDVTFADGSHGVTLDVESVDKPVYGSGKVMTWDGKLKEGNLRFADSVDRSVWNFEMHKNDDGGGYMTLTHRNVNGLEVTDLHVPERSTMGEEIRIGATLTNVTDAERTEDVKMLIDGEVQTSRPVTLAAGASDVVNFTYTIPEGAEPGKIDLRVAGEEDYGTANILVTPFLAPGEVSAADTSSGSEIKVEKLTASTGEPRQFLAGRIVDGDRDTRWGVVMDDPIWVQFELNKEVSLDKMQFLRGGRTRGATVQVKVSDDGENWNTMFKGKPEVGGRNIESIKFEPVDTRYVRFVSHRGPGPHGKQNWIRELRIGDLPGNAYADIEAPTYTEDTKYMEDHTALEPPFPKTMEEIKEYRRMVLKRGFQRAGHTPDGGDPIRIDSLEELWKYGLRDGVHVKMKPGEYRIDSDNIDKFADRRGGNTAKLFVFRGHNSYFDLRGVTITFDAKAFAHYGGGMDWNPLFDLQANNLVLRGLTVDTINKRARVQGHPYLNTVADSILIWDVEITTGGSIPYGYGKLLGKGGASNITKVRKGHGIGIHGNHVELVGVNLHVRHFGHALTTKGRNTFIDCHIEGDELRRTSEILKETSGPAYEVDFENTWSDGGKIQPGNVISLHEEAWRTYGDYTATMILNCTVQRTSGGFNTHSAGHRKSGLYASHSAWRQCHQFDISPRSGSTFNKCAIDVSYGRGLVIDKANSVTGDFTILPSPTPLYDEPKSKVGILIEGKNHDLTFKQDVQDLKIRGSRWIEVDNAENVTIDNRTDLPIKLKKGAKNCTIKSTAPVKDSGSGNRVDRLP